jgi:deoxyadenosine/deoxycytidine kinase
MREVPEPDRPGPARYVAVDGAPGAGASALALALAEATGSRLALDPAADNPFRDDFARDPRRFAFQTQVFCLLARYRQQIELAQPDLFQPAGLVADYVFARDFLYARTTLPPEELTLYQRIHALLDARTPTPDLVVYLTADREVLRSRVRRLVSSSDRMIKLNVIERLAAEMDEHFFSYESGPLLVINTSEYDFVERRADLGEFIELIEKTRAGVHHYRPMQTAR